MNPPKGGHSCIVRSCKSRSIDKNIRFFRVPREHPRAMDWLQASNRMDLKDKSAIDLYNNYKICALHFKKSMYTSPEENRLLPSAAPTEFDNIKSYCYKRSPSPPPDDSAKKLKTTSEESTQLNTTPDHTYHKSVNTKVQEELDKLTSSLIDFGPAILKPVVSQPTPSILKSVLTATNKPVETIDLTTQDLEPITKRQPEIHKITQGSKSYLLIPKELMQFTQVKKQQTFVIPSSLSAISAPVNSLKSIPESPKNENQKTVDSTSSIPEPLKKTPDSTSAIPAPSRYISDPTESPKKIVENPSVPAPDNYMKCAPQPPQLLLNSSLSLQAPENYMKYAPQPPQLLNSALSLQARPTSSVTTSIHRKSNITHVKIQTSTQLLSTLPRVVKQRKVIKALTRKNSKLQKLLNNKLAPKPTVELFSKCCDIFLTPPMAEFVKTQAQLCNVSERGRRYNDEYKEFAEKMYSLGPRCYRYLQKLFCLPSMKSLQREKARTLQNQENEKLPEQAPAESLHYVSKQIQCLPPLYTEQVQQARTFEPILEIENAPDLEDIKIQPVIIQQIKYSPDSENERLEESIKLLEPITQPLTYLPDLSEL